MVEGIKIALRFITNIILLLTVGDKAFRDTDEQPKEKSTPTIGIRN